jgi:dynactin complex subunit
MTSIKEKQVDKVLDRIIGNGDEVLKVITKLAMMNKEITPEIIETIEMLKKQNEEDVKALNDELEMTLDASGNLVPITFTIENNVINNVNGIYRLPVGKT